MHSCEAELAEKQGSVIQQLQQIGDRERARNKRAIKALLRCTHFLARQHIAHTTNFGKLIDLVVSCGDEDLKQFVECAGRNATYTSKDAVVEFVQTIGQWVEESLLKRLHQAPFYSLMADECTDVSTIEELSIFCRWLEDGLPSGTLSGGNSLKKNGCQHHLLDPNRFYAGEGDTTEQACRNGL